MNHGLILLEQTETMAYTTPKYVLLDEEGNPIRYFDYPAEGTVEVKEEVYKIDWNNFEEALL